MTVPVRRTADLPLSGQDRYVSVQHLGPSGGWLGGCDDHTRATGPEGPVKKSDREIMEILEAFDATGVAHSAAQLAGADPKTVRRYAQARDLGRPVTEPALRPKLIDPFLEKVEEWVERSKGKVRADKVHERLVTMGFAGDERTTRRAVAAARARWRAGHARTVPAVGHRAWAVASVGLGKGPRVPGPDGTLRETLLFCAWLAWSRFRVVL